MSPQHTLLTSNIKPVTQTSRECTNEQANSTIACAFDIDGVLLRGRNRLPGAAEALKKLQEQKIPFIFLTNGGGSTEADHVKLLGKRLSVPNLSEHQFVQSHTPFRDLVPELRDCNILVLGGVGGKIRHVAKAYGFKHVLTPSDIVKTYQNVYPFLEVTKDHHHEHGCEKNILRDDQGNIKISAILVWSSPRDWGLDLQLVIDLLLSSKGVVGTISPLNGNSDLPNRGYGQDSQPALHFCNPDLTWATSYHLPRVAQGTFAAALKGIWDANTGGDVEMCRVSTVGKPMVETYEYAERVLLNWNESLNGTSKIRTVYMIGDNPASDIQGANNFRSRSRVEWRGVLVESGVYEKGTVPEHIPDRIAEGVNEAVEWVLEQEKIKTV